MSLDSNAIITVDELISSMGINRNDLLLPFLDIYNSSSDATAATVTITSTTMVLAITGGANAGSHTITFADADSDTMSELVTKIEALAHGWVINRLCVSAQPSNNLMADSISCLLVANKTTLNGFNGLMLDEIINSSSKMIDVFCKRTFAETTHTDLLNGTGSARLLLDHFPIILVTSVKQWEYYSASAIYTYAVNTEYTLYEDAGIVYMNGGSTKGIKNYQIIYSAGYSASDMPEDIKFACKEICKLMYFKKDKSGIKSESIGDYSVTFTDNNIADMMPIPSEIIAILNKYRRRDHRI